MDQEQLVAKLDSLLASGDLSTLESFSRQALTQHRFYLWHLYLILALLRSGRRDDAASELDELFTYKFNIADRAWPEIKSAFPEKFEQHFILNTMKPEVGIEGGAQVRKRWDVPYPLADAAGFARAVDQLVADAVPALPPLARETPVTTFGSCFAANLARMLKSAGVDATNLLIEESINSPLANRAFLEGLVEAGNANVARMEATYGAEFLKRAREQLGRAEVIVLTLGVAPAFFHRADGRLAFLEDYRVLLHEGAVEMRTPGVEDTKRAIGDMLGLVRRLNAAARLYVSISPVPLMGTAELASALTADCVSKSTLRAALHEVLQADAVSGVHYWPSFEMVRWLGAHTTLPAFGADDKVSRHVSNWLVEMIVERFSHHLFGTPAASASPASVKVAPEAKRLSRWS
ncbi:MAG TPA: GSCFA domain-containing protein [Usitatibacter sp.]|nr:GSCFA domain-containing protein [Usitatibacter sp.]